MNQRGQYPDMFDTIEGNDRLYLWLAVVCIIATIGIVAMYEL
ncbi:MAG: hypothetical protein K0S45_1185 [Nitrospira sp.]|jgi:hypothetical protein|nr:hypothetical protein [Nitrospira sp.]